jgi:hypothetical protein
VFVDTWALLVLVSAGLQAWWLHVKGQHVILLAVSAGCCAMVAIISMCTVMSSQSMVVQRGLWYAELELVHACCPTWQVLGVCSCLQVCAKESGCLKLRMLGFSMCPSTE